MGSFAYLQCLLLCLSTLASAARLTVSIPPSPPLLANPASLPPSTHATLLGEPGVLHDARLTRKNTFDFTNLTPGSYLLNIYTRDYLFSPFRVDVSLTSAGADGVSGGEELVEVWQTFRGNEWSNKGPKFGEAKSEVVVELRPTAQKDFYQQRGGFNILGFLKSPMILMALASVGLIFGMPYLMENMDPETKADFEEMSKKSPISGSEGAAAAVQNFDLASWMAGSSKPSASSGSSTPATGGAKPKR